MKHTPQCKMDNETHKEYVEKFRSDHPNYCPACNGWGELTSPGDSVPYGSTYASLPDTSDPCYMCVDQGKCPLCREEVLDITASDVEWNKALSSPCPKCGSMMRGAGLNDGPECIRWDGQEE